MSTEERESMEFDVVVVGAGPAGLATACRLMQIAEEKEQEISVVVLEKGSEVGAHILSGAVIEPKALTELFPDWKENGAPLKTAVTRDDILFFTGAEKSIKMPGFLSPKTMHNHGNYVASLGNLTRWLGEQAEALGVEIFPGFAAAEILYHEDGRIKGVATGDMGLDIDGNPKSGHERGMELHAKYTVFAEGCRGHLGKQLISQFNLDEGKSPQHYGIGLKELWQIDPDKHEPGVVLHGAGWPLSETKTTGGGFLYHLEDNQVVVGLIIDLNYSNPHLNTFEEFQRFKQHPAVKKALEGGERVSYGARAIVKGGLNSLPRMSMPGGLLVGCDAGTLNFAKIKGTDIPDHACLKPADSSFQPDYPKPDGKITFDKPSSVFLSNTNHEDNQPVHLQLQDPSIPIQVNLPKYAEPAQRYCPVGVYEVIIESDIPRFQINSQNCIHCKTCDIKDPAQNITWVVPEGGGGPNYPNM